MDRSRVEPQKRGGVPNRTQIFCLLFYTMLLSAHVQRVSVSRMRDLSILYSYIRFALILKNSKVYGIKIKMSIILFRGLG